MLKQETGMLQGGWSRPCDACRSAASTIFCRTDALYLCSSCDTHAHFSGTGSPPPHERVWVCEACEQAPAVFACKADCAALCVTCDMDIHSHPLASRHHRVLVLPLSSSVPADFARERANVISPFLLGEPCVYPEEAAMPFLQGHAILPENRNYFDFLDCNGVEEYQDLDESKPLPAVDDRIYDFNRLLDNGYDCDHAVPIQFGGELGFGVPKVEVLENYNLGYSISSSPIKANVVPETTLTTESSKSDGGLSHGTLDLFEQPMDQATARVDRQARLLRYREKKKRRNFDKTIRYASRKAYAELRPRIKGRFAKIMNPEPTAADRILHATYSAELTYEYAAYGCGVVPSL